MFLSPVTCLALPTFLAMTAFMLKPLKGWIAADGTDKHIHTQTEVATFRIYLGRADTVKIKYYMENIVFICRKWSNGFSQREFLFLPSRLPERK